MDDRLIFLLLLMVGFLIIRVIYRNRSKPLSGPETAQILDLTFHAEKTHAIQPALNFINRLQYGKKHFASNVFTGTFKGYEIMAFDFRYEVEVMCGKSNTVVEEPYCFYVLYLPRTFDQEVTIYKEGLLSKIKQWTGGKDIDFESHEFSRKFRVRSPSVKFAYDICNARMIEYLLKNTDLSVEIDKNVLCISFESPLRFEDVNKNLLRLVAIRERIPDYLFDI